MSEFDRLFDELHRSLFIGFDRFRPLLADFQKRTTIPSFPPFNLYQKQIGEKGFDGDYVLQLALAGYSAEDIQVSLAKNVLTIESAGAAEDSQNYLHKGIAKRAFKVSFPVADGVVVKSAEMNNGLLEVTLSVELPKDEIKKIPVLSK